MIKRLYTIQGTLLAPITTTTDDIAVDADTGAKLVAGLSIVGDYCYLTLIEADKLEVIKITKDFVGLDVLRGQAGTPKYTFSTAAKIVYRLTDAEIQDAIATATLNIFGSGYGVATVTKENSTWTVSLPRTIFETPGGVEAQTTDENQIVITDKVGAFGCCDGTVTGAPGIGGPYFYLTTSPYSHRVTEAITGQPAVDGFGTPYIPMPPGKQWLLIQPTISGDALQTGISVLDGELFGGAKAYSLVEEIQGDVVILEGELFGGAQVYSLREELEGDAYVLIGQLFGGSVEYNYAYDWVSSSITVLDGTLTTP